MENGNSKLSEDGSNEEEYLANLRTLNETVASWVTEHVKKNKCCILTPIFRDYEKHLKGLEEKCKSKTNQVGKTASSSSPVKNTPAEGATFLFGKALDSTAASNKTAHSAADKEGETAEPSKAAATGGLNLFGNSSSSAPSPFTFGSTKPFAAGSSAAPFSFGSSSASSATAPAATAGFSFGFANHKPPVSADKEADKEAEERDEDEEDQPPKVEVTKVQEDDAFYSIR